MQLIVEQAEEGDTIHPSMLSWFTSCQTFYAYVHLYHSRYVGDCTNYTFQRRNNICRRFPDYITHATFDERLRGIRNFNGDLRCLPENIASVHFSNTFTQSLCFLPKTVTRVSLGPWYSTRDPMPSTVKHVTKREPIYYR